MLLQEGSILDFSISESGTDCAQQSCDAQQFFTYQLQQMKQQAQQHSMLIDVLSCPEIAQRYCIYISWGGTRPSEGSGATHCTNGGNYVIDAKCVFMESHYAP